ncbi:MAG: SEC-C metal-binding domain-containing protein [Rubrivivax sp.]
MHQKIGRNEPCPCGSGKKYKNCHARVAAEEVSAAHAHDGAIGRAVSWLAQYHRKALAEALQEAVHEAVLEIFELDETATAEAMQRIDGELWQMLQQNLTEWLMAEGDILVKGHHDRVSELLLGLGGPLFTSGQRAWLEQLAQRPLRLYDVTQVVAGESITLCDALDCESPPVLVSEVAGSRQMKVSTQIGARLMRVGDGHQLSGALYVFAPRAGRALLGELQTREIGPNALEEDDVLAIGLRIIEVWLAQFLKPRPMPDMVHAATGEPLLFVTDHYDVHDWDALIAALAAQHDVQGDRESGWSRLFEGQDGLSRALAVVAQEADGKRVSVSYQTAGLAESGRPWFDALAGSAASFRLREQSDPKGLLSHRAASGVGAGASASPALPSGIDPAALADALAKLIRNTYANWADEAIPALGGQTPRQAMRSEAGLERVKGLLRSYEDGEAEKAARDRRSLIDYQFLWDSLGLKR